MPGSFRVMENRIGSSLVVLAIAMLGLAWWRAACVLAGPDIDTDAYAHHMIARAILADPRDLAVHWVWLPLFHYLQVPLVALGGTMDHLRWTNVVLTAALPWVLFGYVRATARPSDAQTPPEATALGAALFAGACPIGMQMGTTAQPEPLFALLVLGVAIAFERRHEVATAAMLGAAVLLRYEAWAVLAIITAALVLETARLAGAAPRPRVWMMVFFPALLIVTWAALRRPVDGRWFGFLGQTHEFADAALGDKRPWYGSASALARDLLYYPIVVPVRVLGPAAALVPFGISRTWRQQGGRFVLVFVACLAFVSLSWALRSSLGLDRHFVAVVPLYATWAAQGAAVLADGVARVWARRARKPRDSQAPLVGRGAGYALALLALVGLGIELRVWMGFWRGSIERGWPERVALGEYLRSLPDVSRIFCDDATLEVTSGLDRRRFDRHWVDDPHTWDLVKTLASESGAVYVATWRRKLRGHEGAGKIVFQAGFDPGNAEATGVAVMRVLGPVLESRLP
jgi:hypothetical protein